MYEAGSADAALPLALLVGVVTAVPLLYGEQSDWARNILAAGGGAMRRGGRTYDLTAPRLVPRDEVPARGLGARYVRAAPTTFLATIVSRSR